MPRRRQVEDAPSRYVIDDPGLVAAVNAALILGQPLLVTGEAGTGKTTLASRVAWQLGLEQPLKFETKSSTTAKDLFYTFDSLGRFQAEKGEGNQLRFVAYKALGLAILYSLPTERANRLFPPPQAHPGAARRTVGLIDEIDKAHRDFPNDLLNELDRRIAHFLSRQWGLLYCRPRRQHLKGRGGTTRSDGSPLKRSFIGSVR